MKRMANVVPIVGTNKSLRRGFEAALLLSDVVFSILVDGALKPEVVLSYIELSGVVHTDTLK